MMTDQVTTVETSERLLELGIPAEKASMVWTTVDDNKTVVERDLCLPENIEGYAFTVYDLLGILPAYIEDEGLTLEMSCFRYGESWAVSYYSQEHNYGLTYICYDLIGALYLAVAGLVNKGYKLNL